MHALAPQAEGRASLAALVREAGVHTALMTDDRSVLDNPLAVEFDEFVEVDPPWQTQMAAEGAYEDTHLAQCIVELIDWVQSPEYRRGPGSRSSSGATSAAWARRGTPRRSAASATGARAIRRS